MMLKATMQANLKVFETRAEGEKNYTNRQSLNHKYSNLIYV